MALIVLRCLFLLVSAGVAASLADSTGTTRPLAVFGAVMALSIAIIIGDIFIRRKSLDIVSSIYFGSIVGVFLSYVLALALDPILSEAAPAYENGAKLVIASVSVYLCVSLLLQTRNDFRFIIPYVEFSREVKGLKPYVLDTSAIIDGRIADVVDAQVLDNQLIMPQFVLSELQAIADSGDRLKRNRGRRGLDILNRLRGNETVDLQVFDRDLPELAGQTVDLKLVLLAKHLEGKIITNDYNLNKVASVHGVQVINLNDLANALKPAYLPGEEINIKIIRPGEEPGQGVGYLDDGTMVVIERGRDHLDETVPITVTKTLQTSAGRMIFGKLEKVKAGSAAR